MEKQFTGTIKNTLTVNNTVGLRNKVILGPGRSLLDWLKFAKNSVDLAGTKGVLLKVTPEELSKHNKPHDVWMALKGRVYNVTPYLEYHPGGIDEMMRGAGVDGSMLFDQTHKFVNFESMLSRCLVGFLVDSNNEASVSKPIISKPTLLLPTDINVNPKAKDNNIPKAKISLPVYSWYQTDSNVVIQIKTYFQHINSDNVIMDCKDHRLLTIFVVGSDQSDKIMWNIEIELDDDITEDYNIKVVDNNVDILLHKVHAGKMWRILGVPINGDGYCENWKSYKLRYRNCSLVKTEPVSHDTKLFTFKLPEGTRLIVPPAHHVYIQINVDGMLLERSYTPVPQTLLTSDDQIGKLLHFMIKVYPDGVLSPKLNSLMPNESCEISDYMGDFQMQKLESCSHLVMFAAGTGLTPMCGLIHAALYGCSNLARIITLVFFNKEEKDILWKEQLNALSKSHSKFQVFYVLSQASSSWTGPRGRINREHFDTFCPQASSGQNILFCACGPTQFSDLCVQLAEEFGYSKSFIEAFKG